MTMDILFSSEVKVDRNGEIITLNLTDEQIGEIISKEGRNFVAARTIGSVIDSVAPKSNAEQAGLRKGDSIVAINGKTPRYFDEFTEVVKANKKGTISLVILRDNALDKITSIVSE
jgi:regulator of sigma E protease